jgi:hypothetical protein
MVVLWRTIVLKVTFFTRKQDIDASYDVVLQHYPRQSLQRKNGSNIFIHDITQNNDIPAKLIARTSIKLGFSAAQAHTVMSIDSIINFKSRFIKPNNEIWK